MKEIHLWNFIHYKLTKKLQVILVAVVNHEKGSPGKRGFKMAISSDGESVGSIGGGVMEYNIVKASAKLFNKEISVKKIEKLYHNRKSSVNKSGLICAGSQTNFTISLQQSDIKNIELIINSLRKNSPGRIIFNQEGVSFNAIDRDVQVSVFRYLDENNWSYEQTIVNENIIYVVGGGHVGLAVCRLMSQLDFYVIIYDSREDLQTMKENKFANEKIIAPFKDLGKVIKDDARVRTFVVIVTTGFESDKEALEQVISKNVMYIGLMGTEVKIKKIFNEAVKSGISKQLLKKVHAPIGIDINSDTPDEIAVSIAAEIIKVKNRDPV